MKNNPVKTSNPNHHMERFYIAYGSNLNLTQMEHRCPTAEVAGQTILKNWRLMFRGTNGSAVATIERSPGYHVPVLVWKLRPQDEQALDRLANEYAVFQNMPVAEAQKALVDILSKVS